SKTFTVNLADPLYPTVPLASGTGTIIPQLARPVGVGGNTPALLPDAATSTPASALPSAALNASVPRTKGIAALEMAFAQASSADADDLFGVNWDRVWAVLVK